MLVSWAGPNALSEAMSFRFSHRRRYRPQLLHGPRWLARGMLQVHSSASVQSATARDEGASGAATIHAFGY